MIPKKYEIQVRIKGSSSFLTPIKRKLRSECIGNFNPIFCTYKGKEHLVKSNKGDLSDPFRREESYTDSLYIEVES